MPAAPSPGTAGAAPPAGVVPANHDLPAELLEFLGRTTPQSLVIRGAPGTGKTLLALALLESYPGRKIYVTSRVRRPNLDQDFPTLARLAQTGQLSVVDMAGAEGGLSAAMRAVESAQGLVTARDRSTQLRALMLPDEVLEAWSQVAPPAPTMVVLDSWDAIIEGHVGTSSTARGTLPSREEIERIAVSQMAEGPVLLLLVIEHREAGQLEYLVNGVVSLEREVHEDRLERWLHIDKLRGTRVARSSYPFSLEGGRFQCLPPMHLDRPNGPMGIDPRPTPCPNQVWPGSAEYASFFGPMPVGKLTLLELESEVPNAVVRILLRPLLNDVIARGGRVLHLPPPAMQPKEVWNIYWGTTSKEAFHRQLRLLCAPPSGESEEFASVILPLPTMDPKGFHPRIPEAETFFAENRDPERPNLMIMSITGMSALNAFVPGSFTPSSIPGFVLHYLHLSPAHGVFIAFAEDPLTRVVRPMADTHVRLIVREGRYFVHGVIPRTPSLVLSEGDERSPYHLRLVV